MYVRKPKCMVMWSRKASTKIVNFIIRGVEVLPPGRGQIWCIVYVNICTFFTSSPEPLDQFQPDLAYSIYGWRGTKIVNFTIPAPLGPWGRGKNFSNLTNFQKSSSLQPHMWRKNWMHGDVEQEGLYQNCVFHYRWGRGFAPRAGQNIWTFLSSFQLLLWNRCTNFNQFWHKASMGEGEQK